MRNIEIITIEKARNNGHCYVEMQGTDRCGREFKGRYSFRIASCKPCYGNVMIDTLTSMPVPAKRFDDYCWDFEGLDSQSEANKEDMRAAFREIACG